MTEWRVKVNGNVEPNLVDVDVVVNANPYGNRATAYIQDVDGKRAKAYQPRSRVDFEAREAGSGNAYQTILQAFVVEPRERSEGGGDRLEVECHSLDQLIRSGDMNGDFSGLTILSALEQLVKNWMDGVSWDASRVNPVRPGITLSRSYNNELIDNILKSFSRLSGGESYGVVDTGSQLVFEFGPRETETLDGLGPGDITEYDIPQKSEDAINEVRVFYDDGQRSVIVDDSTDKRQLQQRLGADEPVTTAESIMREQITERQAAVAVGEEYLSDRGTPREVTVQSFGLLDAGPGDTIPIRLPRANINDEYVVAQVEWSVPDEATLTAIRKTDIERKSDSSTSEMLVRASDSLQRVEMRPAQSQNNLTEKVRMVETDVGVTVGTSGTVGGVNLDTYAILNSGYETLRDAIINQSAVTLDTVVLGSDGTDAARPQSGIQSSVGTASASVSVSGSDKLTVTASPSVSGDVREVVVQDSTGTPILRATLVSAVSGPSSVALTLTVDNDDSKPGAVTETGQTMVRDALANNSPTWPSDYQVGDGGATVDPTTTSLSNPLLSRALGNEIVASGSTTRQLRALANTPVSKPVTIEQDAIKHEQVAYAFDVPSDAVLDTAGTTTGSQFTGGEAANFDGSGTDVIQLAVETDYEIPSQHAGIAVRARSSQGDIVGVQYRGTVSYEASVGTSMDWIDVPAAQDILTSTESLVISNTFAGNNPQDLDVDCVAVYDTRYVSGDPSTWDNTVSSGGHLEDPKLYPEATTINLGDPPISVQSPVTELSISSAWNDTSNQQKFNVEGTITNNSQAASGSFTSTTDISASTTLSRYSSGSASTPTVGDLGHEIDSLEYTTGTSEIAEIAGIDALDLVSYAGPGSLSPGTQLNESGILDSNGNLLSISNISFTAESDLTLAVTETLELSRAPLLVNESNFDVGLVSLTGVSSSGTSYQVAITGTSTSI